MSLRPLGALLLALSLASGAAGAGEVLPLEQVHPGMEGTGRTVFEGARVDEFGVRILGVLDNALGPHRSVILAHLDGGPLAETGVIQGMSGSPVFIDGKLVGAVAYAFPFGKEPIAGITRGETLPPRLAGSSLTPLALPLVFSGFDPSTFEWARELFASMGFTPVLGTGPSGSRTIGPLPDLEPGAAVGVSLIEGDLDLSVTGTITHIEGTRVYAFGHPFYNLGPTKFPMKKAYVYSVFPSLQVSWKIAAALEAVGTVDQDRTTAIAGRLGTPPSMISSEVRLHSGRTGDRSFQFRLVEDELFTPVLAYLSLLSVLQSHERAVGTTTLRLDARVVLDGGREVRVKDVFAADSPAQRAAALVAGPVGLLVANDFEKVEIESIDVDVAVEEEDRSATIVRAWVDPAHRLRPGTTTTLTVLLRTHRGDFVTHSLALPIPRGAPPGNYDLLVADAATFNLVEQQEMRQPFVPRDLDHLLRALNELRAGSHVYARLTQPGQGVILGGEYLPALPGSVLSVLRAPDQGASVVPLRASEVWSSKKATDHAISGARRLRLHVEP
jgi:hypothetical protein